MFSTLSLKHLCVDTSIFVFVEGLLAALMNILKIFYIQKIHSISLLDDLEWSVVEQLFKLLQTSWSSTLDVQSDEARTN